MNSLKTWTITVLRCILGIVVLLESIHFTMSPYTVHHLAKMGLPPWVRFALGGSEIVAALLFLIPSRIAIGGYSLLFIFGVAIAIHVLHGEWDVGNLLIYSAAVLVCVQR